MLPMRALRAAPSAGLVRNRFGLVSFHDVDHGDGRADSLAWLAAQRKLGAGETPSFPHLTGFDPLAARRLRAACRAVSG